MTFHGQSLLSCVWGVTHSAAAPESTVLPVEMRGRSGVRPPARLKMLSRVMRKLRSDNSGTGTGPAHQR